jgi:hypothetical protein
MIYLDSAAVVKLAHAEAESPALRAWLDGPAETGWASSVLTEIESFRALARYAPDAVSRLPAVLDQIELIDLDPPIQIQAQTAEYGASPSTRRRTQYRMFGVSNTANDGRVSSPIEVPEDIVERVSSLCLALTRGDDADRRLTNRSEIDGAFVRHPPQAVLPARGTAGPGRPARPLASDTDWEEIRELVTDSYRRLAPKKLTALLDQQRRQ